MSRSTIDFGIDLGTTNSAIAVLRGTIPEIIKNNLQIDITPSAVFIDKRGQVQVGERAKNRQEDDNAADDVYIEFKRHMGTARRYEFKTAGCMMTPEEVSAEVLKSLKADVQSRYAGENIEAVVITVPAAFEAKQCAATKKAGELAGFTQCPLLQEPVAAALAYGFQVDVVKEYWLVYDFGGGTFDAAIMKAEDGSISVVNHGGDNYLGGSDMDWAILEQLVIPELTATFNLPDFRRGNKTWRTAIAKLKNKIEAAKIQLSRSDTAYLEDCRFKDAEGKIIEVEFKLTRDALVGVVEPIIMRSVEICKRVLKEKNLSPSAIEKVILVGGPTLAPYFREILTSNLGIQLDYSVDPLTVVAKGASVFAGTQRIEGAAVKKATVGQFGIELKYKPVGADEDPTIRGEVKGGAGGSVEGYSIEFVNQKTHWRSGKLQLKVDGRFKVNLLAERGVQNIFSIKLYDVKGTLQVVVPDNLTYTIGLAISEQPIINSIAIALANNESDVFFKKGDPLPAKANRVYRSTHAVAKGSSENILNIPVVEGEIEQADRNRLLGKLVIDGTNVRRDVPAGSEVEVTLHMDASRIIRAKAYIPILDEEYEAVIDYNRIPPDPKRLKVEFNYELKRINTLRESANDTDNLQSRSSLDELENVDEIEMLIDTAADDPDAANKAERRLLELKVKIDRAEDRIKWPSLVTEANRILDELDNLIGEHGTPQHRESAIKLRKQVSDLIAEKRAEPLRKRMEQVLDLHRTILFELPGFWVGFFNHLVQERIKMKDQITAEKLINQGRQSINRGDVQGLRSAVAQLLGLIPDAERDAIQRGYQSGLLK